MGNTHNTISNEKCRFEIEVNQYKSICSKEQSGKQFILSVIEEFTLQLEYDGIQEVLCSSNCEYKTFLQGNQITTVYTHPAGEITVEYKLDGTAALKTIRINAKKPLLIQYAQTELSTASLPLSRGGEGQPVFLGTTGFTGSMYPVSLNKIDGNTVQLDQAPFISLKTGDHFAFAPVVYGLCVTDSVEDSVIDFIHKRKVHPSRSMRIYCDWAAHDELSDEKCEKLSEKMALRILKTLEKVRHEKDVCFDYYLMDDFWFQQDKPYTEFNPETWPDGPDHFLKQVDKHGMKYGLWFDVNMASVNVSDETPKRQENGKEICLNYQENMDLLFTSIEKHVREHQVRMLKFDFAYFECMNENHHCHSKRAVASKEPAVRKFIEKLNYLRTIDPELMILAYNGFTTDLSYIGSVNPSRTGYAISPWWCLFVDYLYCGDPRPSEIPGVDLEKSLIFYTDSMIEQFHKSLVPYDAIDDHGTMVGNTATIYYLGKKPLRDSWIMNLARGNKKEHLYGEVDLLSDADWEFIKNTQDMFDYICKDDCRTQSLPGSPSKGEIYGYHNTTGNSGFLTVVNSCRIPKHININLPEWLPGDAIITQCCYKDGLFNRNPEKRRNAGLNLKLEPDSVEVYYWERDPEKLSTGYILIDGGKSIQLPMKADCTRLGISFIQDDFSPLRAPNQERDDITIRCHDAVLNRMNTKNIWSGVSWFVYDVNEISGNGYLMNFMNSGTDPVTIKWQKLVRNGG